MPRSTTCEESWPVLGAVTMFSKSYLTAFASTSSATTVGVVGTGISDGWLTSLRSPVELAATMLSASAVENSDSALSWVAPCTGLTIG